MSKRGGVEADRRARGGETRQRLIDAGRSLFADPGYFETGIATIVEHAGVGTRGAFYHHFVDKADLFRAVYEEIERDLVLRAIASPPPGDPWERLVHGLHTCLDAALEPEVQRVMLLDGPAILGVRVRREIEDSNSLAMIKTVLESAMDDGVIARQPVRELAHAVLAAVEELSILVADDDDQQAARDRARQVLSRLLTTMTD